MNNEAQKKKDRKAIILFVIIGVIMFIGTIVFVVFVYFLANFLINDSIKEIGTFDELRINSFYEEPKNSFSAAIDEKMFTTYEEFHRYFDTDAITEEDFEEHNFYAFAVEYSPCNHKNPKVNSFSSNSHNGAHSYEITITHAHGCKKCDNQYKYYAIKVPGKDSTIDSITVDYSSNGGVCVDVDIK